MSRTFFRVVYRIPDFLDMGPAFWAFGWVWVCDFTQNVEWGITRARDAEFGPPPPFEMRHEHGALRWRACCSASSRDRDRCCMFVLVVFVVRCHCQAIGDVRCLGCSMEIAMRYTVTLDDGNGHLMQTKHDYRPYAEKQAEIWRRLYPDYTVTITMEHDNVQSS